MSDNSIPTNLEILKMAREIVHNEYVDTKAQLHNKWIADADLLWKTTRTRLAYPAFPPFPTEDVVVARAKVLKNFLTNGKETEEPTQPQQEAKIESKEEQRDEPVTVTANSPQEPTQEPVTIVEPKSDSTYNHDNKELHGEALEEAMDKNIKEYTRTVVARRIDDEMNMPSRILPSLMKRIDEIKKNWTPSNGSAT